MSVEQAFLYLKQMLIAKSGLSIDECANIATAWNIIALAIKYKSLQAVPPKETDAGN